MKSINLRGKILKLPAFFPDATYGHIIGVSSKELQDIKVQGLVVNTYHLFKSGLFEQIKDIGIHKYMKFPYPVISDSGGFQVFSLIHQHPDKGSISEEGATFIHDNREIILTPETCMQIQLKINPDIVMCLDDCTHSSISYSSQKKSVERTIRWAKRCKDEYLKLTKNIKLKPKLFAIIQGGNNKNLRKFCYKELEKIGFDGYAFGGWPIKNGKLLEKILKYTASLIPEDKIKYCMGVGKPKDIIKCVKFGYNLFDCVIPTRDARHKRLYYYNKKQIKEINIRKKYFKKTISKEFKLHELAALFKSNHNRAINLTTKFNLKTYVRLMNSF